MRDEPMQIHWRARAFAADARDVCVELGGPQPHAVTAVLGQCLRDAAGTSPAELELWRWNIVQRLQALLQVAMASGVDRLELTRDCDHCAQPVSFELPLDGFVQTPSAAVLDFHTPDGESHVLRLPTGEDQRRWLAQGEQNPDNMLRDLLEQSPRDLHAMLPLMEERLAAADPFTALELDSSCPYCEGQLHIPLDLESELLRRLRRRQTRRLHEVHRLARGYHWSEAEILALPASRRDFYLACLEAEGRA